MEKKNRMEKKKKVAMAGVLIGMLVIACALFLFIKYRQYKTEMEQNMARMNDIVAQVTIEVKEETNTEENGTGKAGMMQSPLHDFEALKEVNQDAYAWITIPGTQVDYPVLQSDQDNKYLDTNIDGSSGYPGCIYSNVCNSRDFDDYITVLYGHNMKSGEMFGSLHNFNDADFFREFETYTVETVKARFIYSVYAAVNYTDDLIPSHYDVKTVSGRDAFLESLETCRENSLTHFNDEIEISGEDKVLVLSVCISGQEKRRYLIVSKLEEVKILWSN